MMLLHKDHCQSRGLDVCEYAPIAKALNDLPQSDKATLRVKFDIAYFIATQKLAFTNYPAMCELQEKHGVNVGTAYRNRNAAKTFCHYIAESKREQLTARLAKAQFFSILMDGSTDVGNIDDELFLVLWCDINCDDQAIHTNMSYFSIQRPKSVDSQGLYDCLQTSLCRLGITMQYQC